MKGMLAAHSPSQRLSKDRLWANLLPLSLSFNHCCCYSIYFTHIYNFLLSSFEKQKPSVMLLQWCSIYPYLHSIHIFIFIYSNYVHMDTDNYNTTVYYLKMNDKLCYFVLCHNKQGSNLHPLAILIYFWGSWEAGHKDWRCQKTGETCKDRHPPLPLTHCTTMQSLLQCQRLFCTVYTVVTILFL